MIIRGFHYFINIKNKSSQKRSVFKRPLCYRYVLVDNGESIRHCCDPWIFLVPKLFRWKITIIECSLQSKFLVWCFQVMVSSPLSYPLIWPAIPTLYQFNIQVSSACCILSVCYCSSFCYVAKVMLFCIACNAVVLYCKKTYRTILILII
jgi:hypothetical protein